jgi:hypothetical protein
MSRTRTAVVVTKRTSLREVRAYLPSNYTASSDADGRIIIQGTDVAGWTLDTYVLPRLASGVIHAREITEEEQA